MEFNAGRTHMKNNSDGFRANKKNKAGLLYILCCEMAWPGLDSVSNKPHWRVFFNFALMFPLTP